MKTAITVGLTLGLSLTQLGCTRGKGDGHDALVVYAASSLTDAFTAVEAGFERAHPGVDVQMTFSGSQVLRLQIEQGAPAEVFASANDAHMDSVEQAGLLKRREVFARNALVVIVPKENPAGITSFADLAKAERIVIGTAGVPVGKYARAALEAGNERYGDTFEADVMAKVVSEEINVRLVRAKVQLGEADAAIVYRTDAVSTDGLAIIPIPEAINVSAAYPIGVLSTDPSADAFVDYVTQGEGQQILVEHGFLPGDA